MEKNSGNVDRRQISKRVPLDRNVIKKTKSRIYRQIKEMEIGTTSELNKNNESSANTGWMTGFLKRHEEKKNISDKIIIELYNGLAKPQKQRLIIEFVLKSFETSAP
ncbi:hypothetical protein CDAR_109171 [Caerostris darwini]|uniref:HTH CENPB-type domain-containing protein n=1 Tax=Caerostris darwini TaxID=1538125 RepID=A0AAV4TTR2_9ARAC|nr:hypothetical protein CDAR_109171 [Caerostris darwini]